MVLFYNKMRRSQHAKLLVSPVWKKELQLWKPKVMISSKSHCTELIAAITYLPVIFTLIPSSFCWMKNKRNGSYNNIENTQAKSSCCCNMQQTIRFCCVTLLFMTKLLCWVLLLVTAIVLACANDSRSTWAPQIYTASALAACTVSSQHVWNDALRMSLTQLMSFTLLFLTTEQNWSNAIIYRHVKPFLKSLSMTFSHNPHKCLFRNCIMSLKLYAWRPR